MKAAIRSMLLADPGVTAIVGDRIYSRRVPQGAAYPALTLELDPEPGVYHGGREHLDGMRLSVDCWARDEAGKAGPTEASRLAGAVVDALTGKQASHGGYALSFGQTSLYEDGLDTETGIYSVAVELSGWARRAG